MANVNSGDALNNGVASAVFAHMTTGLITYLVVWTMTVIVFLQYD